MKKIIAALALVLTLALPGMASAEGTGMYLAPKFIMSIQDTGNVERSGSLAGTGVDEYSQFTLGGAFAVGYDFWPQQMLPLRAELEFALRANSETSWDGRIGGLATNIKGTWNNSTLFANLFWDFHNDSAFTPYIGGGLGLAFHYVGYDFKAADGTNISADDRYTNFAWNLGAGASYSFTENLALDAGYRFVSMGYTEVKANNGDTRACIGNIPYNNEFTLGLRFTF